MYKTLRSSGSDPILIGAPQGSGLGPKSFVAYAEDVSEIFDFYRIPHHLFADDMQGINHAKPSFAPGVVSVIEDCMSAVNSWCSSKRLQLNTSKTEVMWFGSATNLKKLAPDVKQLHPGADVIEPVEIVRDLGVFFDSQLTMKSHIARTASACFYHIRVFERFVVGSDRKSQLDLYQR